jgi:hypothetical protein
MISLLLITCVLTIICLVVSFYVDNSLTNKFILATIGGIHATCIVAAIVLK